MKKILINACLAAFAGLALAACSGRDQRVSTADVNNFAIDETIKTASQSFSYQSEAEPTMKGYGILSASIQWPEKLGNYSLKVLQDSLVAKAFGAVPSGRGIDGEIMNFVSKPEAFDFQNVKWEKADSIPAGEQSDRAVFIQVTARVADRTEQMVTYQVINSSYLGGAHPYTAVDPFTYDLTTGRVLDASNMFVANSESAILEVVKKELAEQLNTTVDKLDDAGIFTQQLTFLGKPYLVNDMVVFHYNPYDIAPYSMGSIDVSVWASEIEKYLTPEVKALVN